MHDGQNLSDPAMAFAETWELDSALWALRRRAIEVIVVGIHNAGETRLIEYSPFGDWRHGDGEGDLYLSFVADTLRPRIDRLFRTRRVAVETAIVGSSMGGLISLYGFFRRPEVFGRAGAMSPSLWYGRDQLFTFVERVRVPRGRVYLDVGTEEGATTVHDARAMARLLQQRGFRRGQTLKYVEEHGARHDEAAWRRRLADALEFLLHDD